MKSSRLSRLNKRYGGALAYVAIRDTGGDEHIGSAFHVGEGVFVTARHVVAGQSIVEVATTVQGQAITRKEATPLQVHDRSGNKLAVDQSALIEPRVLQVVEGPFYHADASVDVAVFRVTGHDARTPCVPLGTHYDEDLDPQTFVLTEAVVFGYPPIPNTDVPCLVAARAEVNAVIDTRHAPHPHFVVSAMARGGFSGGPVVSEFGYAIGVVTESLVKGEAPPELGFMTVLGVESIYACIARHFDLPGNIGHHTFVENTIVRYRLRHDGIAELNPRLASATVSAFDDDRDIFITVTCRQPEALAAAHAAIGRVTPIKHVPRGPGELFVLPTANPPWEVINSAALAAVEALTLMGYGLVRSNNDKGA